MRRLLAAAAGGRGVRPWTPRACALARAVPVAGACRRLGIAAAAQLPPGPLAGADAIAAARRLTAAAGSADAGLEELCADARVGEFLTALAGACRDMDPQDLRALLAAFLPTGHMPGALWDGGLAAEMPRALAELPDMHAVHVALMMASLGLRRPPELLQEVAEQLDARAAALPAQGLAGAAAALSQLGPWSDPALGEAVVEEACQKLEQLGPRELTALALAVATLARRDLAFWQRAHGALFGLVDQMMASQVADTLLAVATAQLCPVNLLEGLQGRLRRLRGELEVDEAITCAWALCSMQLLQEGLHPDLLERATCAEAWELTGKQASQLRQVALTMELEPSASRAREALPQPLRARLRDACAGADADHGRGDEEAAEELAGLLGESGAGLALAELVGDLYVVDLAVRPQGAPPVAVLLDGAAHAADEVPGDVWTVLKCRHLRRLGWAVAWLPAPRWRAGSDEDRHGIAAGLLSTEWPVAAPL